MFGYVYSRTKHKVYSKVPDSIYILTGSDGFLTNSAKVYRRNLMYITMISFSLVYVGYDREIKSIFGISFEEAMMINDFIPLLVAAIIYELVMLFTQLGECRSRWYGNYFENQEKEKNMQIIKEKIRLGHPNLYENIGSCTYSKVSKSIAIHDMQFLASVNHIYKSMEQYGEPFHRELENVRDSLKKYTANASYPTQDHVISITDSLSLASHRFTKTMEELEPHIIRLNSSRSNDLLHEIKIQREQNREVIDLLEKFIVTPKKYLLLDFYMPLAFSLSTIGYISFKSITLNEISNEISNEIVSKIQLILIQ